MTSANMKHPRISLTKEKLANLKHHIKRTQVKVPTLLKERSSETGGLTYKIVYDWLTGRIKTADENQYAALLQILEEIPDWDEKYIEITKKELQTLKTHKVRTGISPKKLLQDRIDIPEGLNYEHIQNILFGRTKTTKRIYFEYVLHEWEKRPDKSPRVSITPALFAKLHEEKLRTGIGPMALLHNSKNDRP